MNYLMLVVVIMFVGLILWRVFEEIFFVRIQGFEALIRSRVKNNRLETKVFFSEPKQKKPLTRVFRIPFKDKFETIFLGPYQCNFSSDNINPKIKCLDGSIVDFGKINICLFIKKEKNAIRLAFSYCLGKITKERIELNFSEDVFDHVRTIVSKKDTSDILGENEEKFIKELKDMLKKDEYFNMIFKIY